MPIPLPNLDDRTYADLTAEARALIPVLNPAWTNHNPSDPGIALVELLTWLTEMLLYQVNQVPESHTVAFLKLLNAPGWTRPPDLDEAVRQTMRDLRERYRAVTADDYEHLALQVWPHTTDAAQLAAQLGGAAIIRRVRCVPRRDLSAADPAVRGQPAPAHVSLVVVPDPVGDNDYPQPDESLTAALSAFLKPRRTLTTRHHVVGPSYVDIGITASLALNADAPPADAFDEARKALAAFLHPLTGGPDRTGWPFGRNVYASEVYAVLDAVSLVNYVEGVAVTGPNAIDAHELVRLRTINLTAYDVYGRSYQETVGP
jgi:hypothetical protein